MTVEGWFMWTFLFIPTQTVFDKDIWQFDKDYPPVFTILLQNLYDQINTLFSASREEKENTAKG